MNKVQKLASIFYEELDRDDWGYVDPYTFAVIATWPDAAPLDPDPDIRGLNEVLERVVARLGELDNLLT